MRQTGLLGATLAATLFGCSMATRIETMAQNGSDHLPRSEQLERDFELYGQEVKSNIKTLQPLFEIDPNEFPRASS